MLCTQVPSFLEKPESSCLSIVSRKPSQQASRGSRRTRIPSYLPIVHGTLAVDCLIVVLVIAALGRAGGLCFLLPLRRLLRLLHLDLRLYMAKC
jgi:hypothetical protein